MLCELDQNSEGIVGMCIENMKSGSWKRRARVNQIRVDKENEKKEDKTKGLDSKRGFELTDENDTLVTEVLIGKKMKISGESMQMIETQVEEASHKWPQMDQ